MKSSPLGAFFLFLLLFVALATSTIGCTTRVAVLGGEDADFSQLRTWAWEGAGVEVADASAAETASLRRSVKREVEEAFARRGFRRVERGADLLVTAVVSLERHVRQVSTSVAPRLVDSYHSSASYWVEGSVVERRVFEDLRIGLSVRPARKPGSGESGDSGESAWRAVTGSSSEQMHGRPTEKLVSSLLAHAPLPVHPLPAQEPVLPGPEGAPRLEAERLANAGR